MRVLIWVQHLLGTGHLRRALTLANALADHGLEVTVASGGPPAPWLQARAVELVQLPPIRSRDLAFSALVTEDGQPAGDAVFAMRRQRLLQLLRSRRPDVLITEMFPFGRRAFRDELLPLLDAAAEASPPPRIVASVRDILVAKPDPARRSWMLELALARYQRVLVHGDPQLIPFEATFPEAAALGARLVHTGYLVEAAAGPSPIGRGEVVISAGGGRVGRALLETALGARQLSNHAAIPWRLIGAVTLPEMRRGPLPPGIIADAQRPDFPAVLANSLLSVSQAGYNTVVEALELGKPMILVPFETGSETEQRVRAERLADWGLAQVVPASALTPARLAQAVDRALDERAAPPVTIDLKGAERSAALVLELARGTERRA